MKSKLFVTVMAVMSLMACGPRHTFSIEGGNFLYDGDTVMIHSGEMHFSRVPKPYWRHRLQMMKAMGLNTVATYVFWNYHETAPGCWDWSSENRDIAEFCKIAQDEDMMVILRSGPYSCGEWEFGGYPWWLQNEKEMVLRTDNQPFLDSCRVYMEQLARQVRDLQITHGGPIIMVQAENEFGSYVSQRQDIPLEVHRRYNAKICQILKDVGFDVPMFTSDGTWLFEGGSVEGALPTGNGEYDVERLKERVNAYHGGEGPYMVAEFYPGWLAHWNEPFPRTASDVVVEITERYLQNGVNFNFYMVHGGTNFAFWSGANYSNDRNIQPDLTSYDYDAPITEAGWPSEKYMAIREAMQKYLAEELPAVPDTIPLISIDNIPLTECTCVPVKDSVISERPMTFEELGQGFGYVLYRKQFKDPAKGILQAKGIADYAVVSVNGQKVGILNRMTETDSLEVDIPAGGVLDLFVENMGRINYGSRISDNLKGIIGDVTLDGKAVYDWCMYKLPMSSVPEKGKTFGKVGAPSLYFGTFDLKETGDTFLDMSSWGKGIVFVNGKNLGRFWNVGPQQTLYLPGCWLNKGKNDIVIFEMLNDSIKESLSSIVTPILYDLKK